MKDPTELPEFNKKLLKYLISQAKHLGSMFTETRPTKPFYYHYHGTKHLIVRTEPNHATHAGLPGFDLYGVPVSLLKQV